MKFSVGIAICMLLSGASGEGCEVGIQMSIHKEADCSDEGEARPLPADEIEKMNSCNPGSTSSMNGVETVLDWRKFTCDTTGMKTIEYTDKDCTKEKFTQTQEWGKCTKVPIMGYLVVTNAEYAKAAIGSMALAIAAYMN